MVYQGSKNRIAKYIVPIMQKYINENNVDTYVEPFVGGGNIIDKIQCENKIGYDYNEALITLLKYVRDNPDIPIAPESVSFEHYKDVRANQFSGKYSPEYVSLIGYCASYGGRYFDGGYGRDAKGGRSIYTERLKNLKMQAPDLFGIHMDVCDYTDINYSKYKNAVFYIDPPYKNTKQYSKQKINYDEFYDICREISKNNKVFISEYWMPDDFKCIWQKERKVMQKSDRITADVAVEKLFTL